jgi:asparagine synthase (glutamine-hydrolysing)
MCGIVGICSEVREISEAKLEQACALMRHRGPDASNVFVDGNVGLGHTRLSIIDLTTAANQPMADPSGQVALVYNGEIYNYRDLRKELSRRGHQFQTSSDTEVLLHLYLEYGEQCLTFLQGMFAFAIWDKRNNTLFAARDRLGIKPLYYSIKGETLVLHLRLRRFWHSMKILTTSTGRLSTITSPFDTRLRLAPYLLESKSCRQPIF